ncbi:vacuolar membrane-associated protein iml1, partial [Clonorchis sinensis]
SGHQIRRINLGQPINRTRVTPCVSSPSCGLDFAANMVCEQQSPVQFQLNSCSTAVARRKPPVYKIIYPQSTVNFMPSSKPTPSENAHFLSGRFTSSPETNESSKCLQSCADQNLFPSTTDHVLTAITTASAVARAVQNANRRPSRCSESDSSSVGDFDWERGLESLAPDSRCSAHRGSLSVEKSLIKSSTQPMIVKGQNTRHLSVVASLPSVREHQSELIKSGQLDRVCFMQAVHRNVVDSEARKKSLSSDADGSVSASSSVDSLITPGSAEFRPPGTTRHTRFSKTYSFTAQRPSSYVGSASDQASKTPALPGLHNQLTPSAPSYRRKSSSRPIRTGFRWSNTLGSGVRVSSTLFPVPASNNPFEAAGNPLSPTGTAGKRRWVLVRPPDEFGNPIPPHHIHLSVRSWDLPNPREAIESCSQVWAAYFNFLRERLGHSAPGGPPPSMDHMDSRTIAGLSSDHVGRSLKLPSGTFSKFSVNREEETWLKGNPLLDQTSSFGPSQWKSLFDPIQQCSVLNDPPHCSGGSLGQSCQLAGGSTLKCLIDTVRNVRNSTSRPPLFLSSEDRAQSDTRGAMLKNVLRLIGTDWKSLSNPALLPIATDYFPDNSSLKTEGYTLHDYRVVPVGVSAQEWESTHDFKREPGLSYCRRPMTVREVFYEMVLQRLGHGFQIYEESLTPSAPPVSSTVGSPGSPLSGTVTGVSPPSLLRTSAAKPVTTRCEQWSNRSIPGSSSLSRKHGVSLGQGRLGNRHRNVPEAPSIGVSPPATQSTQTCTTVAVRTLGIGLTLSSTGSSVRASSKHLARPGRTGCRTPFLTQPLLDRLMPAHKTSFKLSIGRLFHSISLVDDSITLTNYRFRQEDPLRMEYTYALRVPDSLTYLPLRTVFTNDTINGLNWSYLDNYLCTRGVSDSYVLLPSLKYWRSRFMMLPIYSNETRRLQDAVKERMNTNGPRVACDVYEDYRLMNHAKFCENFVHFIESINRIRRPPSSARKPARQILLDAGWIRHASGNPAHAFIYGCYIYTLLLPDTKLLSPTSTDASTTPFLEAVDVTGQSTPITPSQPHFAGLSNAASQTSINTCQNLGQTKGSDVGTNASVAPIPGSLTIQPTAFPEPFLPRATSGSTEWSADFQTDWAEVAFAHNACSSSRSPSHSTTDLNRCTLDTTVNHAFPSSFCPGGFLTYTNISTLCDVKSKTGYQELESVLYKSCLCDFDDPTPEGRTEWAHVLYTANFHPQCAFTIELQWLVASGARLTELVNHWHNRAGMSEFHFFPIPCHPFGHAGIFPDVDPLRCPLSIPLNVAPLLRYAAEMLPNRASSAGTLKDSPVLPPSWNGQSNYSAMVVASKLFVGYPSNQQLHLLRSFQHQLLNRFGFIRDTYDADQNPTDGTNFTMPAVTRNWTYVHCSGSIFVMIPVYRTESHIPNLPSEETSTNLTGCNTWMSAQPPPQCNPMNSSKSPQKMDSAFSTASAPQTGRGNAADNPEYYNACFVEQLNTGFFWVWNHMLPRKRRCYLTGDECFQDAMLADFRAFMTAEDDRLVHAFEVFIGNLNSPSDDDPNESFKKQD